jgi:hypothetical protein
VVDAFATQRRWWVSQYAHQGFAQITSAQVLPARLRYAREMLQHTLKLSERERAAQCGATLQIESEVGGGTTIRVSAPDLFTSVEK